MIHRRDDAPGGAGQPDGLDLEALAHDPRCPVGETEQAREALSRLGRPFECVIYADEGHGFRREENRVDAYRRQATFLARYLGL